MSTKTDVLIQQLSIETIMSFEAIKMPIFQRRYSWGDKKDDKKENKALEYFEDFLTNKQANSFFGSIFIHSSERFDYTNAKNVRVFLSDGQHRVITLVLTALALTETVSLLDLSSLEDIDEKNDLLTSSALRTPLESSIESIIDGKGNKEKVVDFIKSRIAYIEKKKQELEEREKKFKSDIEKNKLIKDINERNIKKNELTKDKSNFKKQVLKEIKEIEEIPLLASYVKIREHLEKKEASSILRIASKFRDRFEQLRAGVISLQPEQGQKVSDEVIEAEAFSMFTQMNGQATPLTPGELFVSFIAQKTEEDDEIRKYFKDKTEEEEILKRFGLKDSSTVTEFLQKINAKTGDTYAWVRYFYKDKESDQQKVNELLSQLNYLKVASKSIDLATEEIKAIFKMFLSLQNTTPTTVYIAKNFINNKVKANDDLRKLLKVLMMISIMISYIPASGKRPNLARDMHHKDGNVNAGLEYVKEHFEMKTVLDLKKEMAKHIETFAFGQQKYRKLAQMLLVIADANTWGKQNQINKNDAYNYEHVFPQKYDLAKLEPSVPQNIKDKYEELLNDDFEKIINVLGNGALLNESANKSLKNSSPYVKLEKLNEQINAWWPTHGQALRDSNYQWDKDYIQKRSVHLAKNITDWLFSDFI